MSACDFSPIEQDVIHVIGQLTEKGQGYRIGERLNLWYLRTNPNSRRGVPKKKLLLIELAIERLRVDGYITVVNDEAKLTAKGRAIYTHLYCKC